ncbi:MAG: hypothetical protein AMJ60_03285 [Desulfobacterales bacterium SG8_35]|nr:MAG: hypothetical protein AMJ60_03285 [Desulfobacterales bacterium SG8_35]
MFQLLPKENYRTYDKKSRDTALLPVVNHYKPFDDGCPVSTGTETEQSVLEDLLLFLNGTLLRKAPHKTAS